MYVSVSLKGQQQRHPGGWRGNSNRKNQTAGTKVKNMPAAQAWSNGTQTGISRPEKIQQHEAISFWGVPYGIKQWAKTHFMKGRECLA